MVLQENIIFVYYKVQSMFYDQSILKIKNFIEEISQEYPEINCELMQRPETSNQGYETCLEIYRGIKKNKMQEFMNHLTRSALKHDLPPQRKIEVFVNIL